MTDYLSLGTKAYITGNFSKATEYFTKLTEMTESSNIVLGFLYRGTSYLELNQLDKAVEDFESGLKINKNSFELKYKLGIALFKLKKFEQADQTFRSALISSTNSEEREKLILWQNKTLIEVTHIKQEQQKKIENYKFSNNWFQTTDNVVVTLDCNRLLNKQTTSIKFEKRSLAIFIEDIKCYEIILSNAINENTSTFKILSQKIELTLAKDVAGFSWITLDSKSANEVQKYPSSHKNKVDFDKVNKEISKDLDPKDGNDGMMYLFKEIYANASEETKRAMMKSYATSGGTVLSTNWGEVKEKDYAGKDRPEAPQGQMWADEKK